MISKSRNWKIRSGNYWAKTNESMKKIIVAILAILYLGSSSGATIHLHYCMGKLVEWSLSFNEQAKDKCSKCGMKKLQSKKGCCKDEYKQIKIEKDQKISHGFFSVAKTITELAPAAFPTYTFTRAIFTTEHFLKDHAPPQTDATSIYISNCVFRI